MQERSVQEDDWPIGKGVAWAGFWLGLGIYLAADVIARHL